MRVRLVLVEEARIVLLGVVVVRVGATATAWLLAHFLFLCSRKQLSMTVYVVLSPIVQGVPTP